MEDLYAILGVPKNAPPASIRSAYRQLAAELHPDRNQGDAAAEEAFKTVSRAYAVLADPLLRDRYDRSACGAGEPAQAPNAPVFKSGRQDPWGRREWYAERDVWESGVCPDCNGTGQLQSSFREACIYCKGWGAIVVQGYAGPEWRQCALC